MDCTELDGTVDFYCKEAIAKSTKKSYASAQKRYMLFCVTHTITALPTTEQSLCRYVAFLAMENLSPATIKCYLSAVRHLQVAKGYGDPHIGSMARLELVLRGVKRVRGKSGQPKPRLPITPDLLGKLREAWLDQPRGKDGSMLWAASALCFFGFLRSGEATVPSDTSFEESSHLTFRDIAVDDLASPTMLRVHLKSSKTDPFRVGVDVVVGKTGNALCPVVAVLNYLIIRGSGPGPLFRFQDGKPLTRARLVEQIREALQRSGVDGTPYSGHSFRSGAATTAAKVGVEDSTIKVLGRWRSSAYQLYIKTPRHQLAAVSKRLAAHP